MVMATAFDFSHQIMFLNAVFRDTEGKAPHYFPELFKKQTKPKSSCPFFSFAFNMRAMGRQG